MSINVEIIKRRAMAKYELNNYAGALEDLNRANEIQPNNAFTLQSRGDTKRRLGDYRGALEDFNRANEILPNNAVILKTRGAAKRMLGDYKGALEDLNRADEIEPNDPFTLRSRGTTKKEFGDFQGALEDLNRANEIEPDDLFTLQCRGEVKRMLQDNEGALEDLNRADIIEPNDAFTLYCRAATKAALFDYEGAIEDLNRADEIEPNVVLTLQTRGITKVQLGDYQGALEDLNRAIERQPNDAFIFAQRAIAQYHLSYYSKALDDITRALRQQPVNKFFLEWKGNIERKIKQLKPEGIDLKKTMEKIKQTNLILTEDFNQYPYDIKKINWKSIEKKIKQTNFLPTNFNQASETNRADEQPNNDAHQSPNISILQGAKVQEGVISDDIIQVPFSELKVLQIIGEGGFGEVSLAEWNGDKVALKKVKLDALVDNMYYEAKTLTRLRYKHIVTLMGVTTDPKTSGIILIIEYMKHGSLEDLLFKQHVKLSRASVIRLALDIALGVNYLHSQKVLHRDLKSANVLLYLKKTRAKISDFGTAKFLHTNVQANTVINNLIAVPPEMLAEDNYDEKVDVFSFGAILYEMLTNKHLPILEETPRIKRIRENIGDEYLQLKDLVLDCCASDPSKRPHMRYIIELLKKMKKESK